MTTSQFTVYTSSDTYGPGYIYGDTGSLIKILDACLVNGYTGKPALGWTQPLTSISASAGGPAVLACYKQPSGSGMTLLINDFGPNLTAGTREAWACGYETITSLTGSTGGGLIFTASYGNGSGGGQFPLPSQLLTYGHVVIRKSTGIDSTTPRPWILFGDAYTFYLFINSGDSGTDYWGFGFGDIFSLAGPGDMWRCIIIGRYIENTTNYTAEVFPDSYIANETNYGHYMARTWGGGGTSIQVGKHGDMGKLTNTCAGGMFGPNGVDNSLYISPYWVVENNGNNIRGRMRGLFCTAQYYTTLGNGQIIEGAGGDYYGGKRFQVVNSISNKKCGGTGTRVAVFIEISPTVETN